MSLDKRKADLIRELERDEAELRRRVERKKRYLAALEAMPDFDDYEDGVILAMTVTYGASSTVNPVIAYNDGGRWYLTGEKSSNGVRGDYLAEWLMSGGRHLRSVEAIAVFTARPAPFDLGEAMMAVLRKTDTEY